ncbi:hypothetical protein BLNAU_1964 [Blattamonas nauphoetae]|uniref:Uncharacterized protein n=1 Tax=Blattamonas nauphoetae TaxID=2049346 RepID=A0ABQ9YGR0_9EUKA|nr:hypothetical protein BLNAU_1964 [Blattamonas nauphoetae]
MLRHFTKMIKKEDIQLLIWEEFTGRDNSQMLDEKVETAPSEYEKPKSKASAKLSKSPAKEKKGKEDDVPPTPHPHHRNTPFLTSSQPKLFWTRLFVHLSNHSAVFRLTAVKPFALTSIFNPHRFQSLFCGIPRVFVSLLFVDASGCIIFDVERRRRRNYQSEEQPQPSTDKAPKKRKLDVFDLIFNKVRKQKGIEADSETDDEMTVCGIDWVPNIKKWDKESSHGGGC